MPDLPEPEPKSGTSLIVICLDWQVIMVALVDWVEHVIVHSLRDRLLF